MGCCSTKDPQAQGKVAKKDNVKLMSGNYHGDEMEWLRLVVPERVKSNVHEHEVQKMTNLDFD